MAGARRQSGGRRGASEEARFRRAVDDLKSSVIMSGVVGKATPIKKAGKEYKGCCPFHHEKTASFYVNDAQGFAHCFGCGWNGDVIRFVMDKMGCGFREAYQRLANTDLPKWEPLEREKAVAADNLERLAKEADARRFFASGGLVEGTDAEIYLRARGITVATPNCMRFGMIPSWRNKETGEWGRNRPALMCGAVDGTGAVVGIQRIFFQNDDPRLGKADCKLSLGTIKGSALRLEPAGETIVMTEGPEDGLSVMQEGPGLPVWVPFGTSMMPAVQFPPIVKRVVIAGQNNTPGRIAAHKAALALMERGLSVTHAWPNDQYDDWNDQLRGGAR